MAARGCEIQEEARGGIKRTNFWPGPGTGIQGSLPLRFTLLVWNQCPMMFEPSQADRKAAGAVASAPAGGGLAGEQEIAPQPHVPKQEPSHNNASLRAAFVLGLGATGLSAVQSLGRKGVPITGFTYRLDDPGRASRYCGRVILCPDPVAEAESFIAALLSERRRWTEDPVLIPVEDAYIVAVNRFREELGRCFRMNIPCKETLELIVEQAPSVPGGGSRGDFRSADFCAHDYA